MTRIAPLRNAPCNRQEAPRICPTYNNQALFIIDQLQVDLCAVQNRLFRFDGRDVMACDVPDVCLVPVESNLIRHPFSDYQEKYIQCKYND